MKSIDPKGSSARAIIEMVSNAGGGMLPFAVTASTNDSGSWLSVSPSSGTVSPSAPVPVSVTADPAGLVPGTYTGVVKIVPASGNAVSVPVIMTLSPVSQGLLLTQTGMSFTGVAQGGTVPPQTFGVVNTGVGALPWTASTSTLSGGASLMASPSSGSTDPAGAAPQVTVSANPAGLAPGDYYGLVRIDAPGAANTPQVVTAFLQVLPAGSDPGPVVQPTEVVYMHQSADYLYYGAPSQDLTIYNVSGSHQTFRTDYTPSSDHSGAADLVVLPRLGQINPLQPVSVVAQPIYAYSGTLTFEFSDGRVQPVKITNLLASSTTSSAIRTGARPLVASSCTPTKLMPAVTTLPQSFTVSAGWPVALSVDVADDCGNPHVSGTVAVNFSSGDPALVLHSLNNGTWQGTWATTTTTQAVSMTIEAANPSLGIIGTREIDGSLASVKDPPAFTQAQLVSAANPVSFAPIAPGSIISIYGDRLAEESEAAQSIPLPTQLGGATVIFGDHQAPLFYGSQGQINAAVPLELATNTTQQLLIQRGLTYSYPIPVDVAPAQPGVFTANGLAIALDYRGTDPAFMVTGQGQARASAGDVLVLYCGGLGATAQPVADGAASPGSTTQNPVTVNLGGQNVPAAYSGLVAGLVGLYQVNFTVPTGITPGTSVPLTLTVSGQTSPVVSLPIF